MSVRRFPIENILFLFGILLFVACMFGLFLRGSQFSFFHQDDVVELGFVSRWDGANSLLHLNNEHVNLTFWPLLYLEWIFFGVNFQYYLVVNFFLHFLVLFFVFVVTKKQTKSVYWSLLAVFGMSVNANWFAVIWWITGQMIILATLFAVLSYLVLLNIADGRDKAFNYFLLFLFSTLPGLSWGVGLSWPLVLLLGHFVDGSKKSKKVISVLIGSSIFLATFYFMTVGKNLGVHTNPSTWITSPISIFWFMLVGVSNTLIGRWIFPIEILPLRVLVLGVLAITFSRIVFVTRKNVRRLGFGIWVSVLAFTTYAIPRWRFGIGHAMTNYYAYFPLAFLLISTIDFLSKVKLGKIGNLIVLAIFVLYMPVSLFAFNEKSKNWVSRPIQTRSYFQKINSISNISKCINDDLLPEFIIPYNKTYKLSYLWPVFKKNFNPICN